MSGASPPGGAAGPDYDRGGDQPTAILIADRPADVQRATALLRGQGVAVVRTLGFGEASGATPDADLLFVEAGGEPDAAYEAVLDQTGHAAQRGQAAIVAIVPELIDRTVARLASQTVAILCNAGAVDAAVTVRLALARARTAGGVRQDATGSAEQLREYGDTLERIARMLVEMADAGETGVPLPPAEAPAERTEVVAADYRRIVRERRLRDQYLGAGLFADPAWDILLDLAAARLEGAPVAVSSLCIAAAVPPTTALRWIGALTDRGLLLRMPDMRDGRRIFMTIAPAAADAMATYVRATRSGDRA